MHVKNETEGHMPFNFIFEITCKCAIQQICFKAYADVSLYIAVLL